MKTTSENLTNAIKEEISHKKVISFARFMELALYHPQWGYYNSPQFELGKTGDFTTAPEISPLFAKCFARQIQSLFKHPEEYDILEIGAGTGRFASVLLPELEQLNSLCTHYYIYEISHTLRKKQQLFLQTTCPTLFSRMIWLEELPQRFKGVVIGNEVLDALPVNCFQIVENDVKERCVSWKNNQFIWQLHEPFTDGLKEKVLYLKDTYHLPPGYHSEINLQLPPFIQAITKALEKGVIFFIDYGYGQKEYYHPERNQGTLTCFYQHHAHANPFIHIGAQDMTAHVDFTTVIESADEACTLAGFTSQAAFLLSCGLLDLAAEEEKNLDIREQVQLHQAIKRLILPMEMGERIKVMAIGKGMDGEVQGFKLKDRRREL